MRMPQTILTLTLTTSTIFLTLASGCKDQSTKAGEDAAAAVEQASMNYTAAMAGADRASELNALAVELSSVSGSEAASLLEANARVDFARAKLDEATMTELEVLAKRDAVRGLVSAAQGLSAVAATYDGFDAGTTRSQVETYRANAQRSLEQVEQALSELEGPIGDIEQQNRQSAQEVIELRRQSEALRNQAFEAGDLQGHQYLMQAVEVDRQADRIEATMSQRTLQLDNLQAQYDYLSLRREKLQAEIQTARDVMTYLNESADRYASTAGTLRDELSRVRNQIDSEMGAIESSMSQLDAIYADAADALEDASDNASQAGRNAASGTLAMHIAQTRGRMHSSQAMGLQNHAAVLAAILATGDAVSGSYRGKLSSVQNKITNHNDEAVSAYEEALAALQASGGSQREAAVLRALLNEAATGEPANIPQVPAGAGGGQANVGGGASSPQALLQMLKQASANQSSGETFVDLLYASNPQAQALKQALASITRAQAQLDAAMQDQFGQSLSDLGELAGQNAQMNMISPAQLFESATISGQTEDTATVTAPGQPNPMKLVRVDGQWYIDVASMLPPGMEQQGGMLVQMLSTMGQGMQSITTRVRNGEFSSADQVGQALMQALFSGMGG